MDDDSSSSEVMQEEADDVASETYSEMAMEPPISITIPGAQDEASSRCSDAAFDDDGRASSSSGSATSSQFSIPASVGSSPMITTCSMGSRSSFDGFPSNSSSVSLSSDRELVNLACIKLRQTPAEVEALDLSTNTRKPRRPLKSLNALSGLTNLVQLDLSGNAVERLDGLQVLTQLQILAMPRNHLKALSAPLFALKGLTHLDLSGNFIVHVPRAFSGLTMLEELNLSGNNLGTLREVDVLGSLANLLSCSLAANPFCRLPTYKDYVICKVRSLERLDDVEISRVARDRAAKRFGAAMFSQDACLREADRAHEDEQNRLLEAQSALEAENLRLKGELQVKSKLLQNKSRAWSSATEQLLQLQQEVAMLNLDRRRSVSLPHDGPSDAEQIAMAIAARHRLSNATQQRPRSAPRIPSPERSVEKRRGSFSDRDRQLRDAEDDEERAVESRDAACTPISPGVAEALQRRRSKLFVDASCSPLRVIPPAILTQVSREQREENCDISQDEADYLEEEARADDAVLSPFQARTDVVPVTRPSTPPATSAAPSRQQRARTQSLDSRLDSNAGKGLRHRSSLDFGLKEDEPLGMHDLNVARLARFPTFEDDAACPAYEDSHYPALQQRSSSASALGSRRRPPGVDDTTASGSHSLPPSPTGSPSRMREWYRKQNELRLLTPPPSPPRRSSSPQYQRPVELSPLAPFVDKDVLARQIQALQSCKQSLLTEIRNEEHLLHVLKQESAQYADQIDCLSVNIQACLDGDPSAIRFSFSPPGSPRSKSSKLREEGTGRARLEILRSKLRFAEDKEKEIETTMVRMTKRVLHQELNPSTGDASLREKFSPVDSSQRSDVPFDKEIFALTHKLQLVIVEKEEICMQMSQLMAQLRGRAGADNFGGDEDDEDGGVSSKQVQSLAKSRQMVDELRTRHREVKDRILLKERRISSLLEELKEVEAELEHISSLNASSALSPLFQRERAATLDFLGTVRARTQANNASHARSEVNGTATAIVESSSRLGNDQAAPVVEGSSDQVSQGSLLPVKLRFKELLSPDMLEEIKADIYEKLSRQLATSAGKSGDEHAADGGRTDLHQAIAAALETRLHLAINPTADANEQDGFEPASSTQEEQVLIDPAPPVDAAASDAVCCDQFDEFAPVEAYYARKFVLARDRVAAFVGSISEEEGNTNSVVTSAQRILKICERLDAAVAKSKVDSVSKIEVDQHGNSRGALKILLVAARDLPTAHLRTKNLDPYVSLEVVYPSHAVPVSSTAEPTAGRILRSHTKKKSIYPVWDESFEFAPILSLNGFLHIRVLNDRRLSREQLVGETRIPLQTLMHQKRIVDWFSLGLNVPPTSGGSTAPGSVISKLCGGAIRLQLHLYFSSVERYKHVVDELVTRHLHDHSELPPFIDAVDACEKRTEHTLPSEQPEQNGNEAFTPSGEMLPFDQRRQSDDEAHFPHDEVQASLPPCSVVAIDKQEAHHTFDGDASKRLSTSEDRDRDSYGSWQSSTTQLSPERRNTLWETKRSDRPAAAATSDDKKPFFGFSAGTATERKKQTPPPVSTATRSRTPTTQTRRVKNVAMLQPHTSLRGRSVETPECFDEYSPYHPAFKSTDLLDACNNELSGGKGGRLAARGTEANRKTDLSIFKRPSLTRRPPSSGFPERYIGLDNQTCERLKRIFGRMDATSSS